jgi:tRNA A-37 threonylcarbamoyl transferase component Bud32
MSIQYCIAQECLDLFGQQGPNGFSAWMKGEIGEVVSQTPLSEVRRVSVGGQEFYLKRRSGEPILKLLLPLVFGWRPMSGPIRELRLVNALAGEGFAVMEPVAWGESTIAGIPQEGFLVVRSIPGRSFAEVYDDSSGANRLAMMGRLGELLGRLHARGFFQHLRFKDLIETPCGGLTIIDRESGRPWARRFSIRGAMTSLARTARRTLRDGHAVGQGAISAFLRGYRNGVRERWHVSHKELGRLAIEKFRKEMSA